MAKTLASVTLDYNKAKKQANTLDSVASSLKTNASKLESTKRDIGSAWKGENATAYLRKLETVTDNITKIESNIKKIATTVRTNSKRTYDAEVAAINLAKTRK